MENWQGKLCYRYCERKKILSKQCKQYKLEVYSFAEIQQKLIDSGFVIIDEDRIGI